MTYKILGNKLIINNNTVKFDFEINSVISKEDIYIVLLDIPIDVNETDNIYGVNVEGEIIWQVENPTISFSISPDTQGYKYYSNSIYVQLSMNDEKIYANTFSGLQYNINYKTGKLHEINITK